MKMSVDRCSVEGCERPLKSVGLCSMHYFRRRRGREIGDAAPLLTRYTTDQCSVEGCDKRRAVNGMCRMHDARVRRHGDPDVVHGPGVLFGEHNTTWAGDAVTYAGAQQRVYRERGPASNNWCACGRQAQGWMFTAGQRSDPSCYVAMCNSCRQTLRFQTTKGGQVTYSGLHQRVRRVRGRADTHPCVDCGGPATQWAYRHDDPNEMHGTEGPYSLDPAHYDPMCASCHVKRDAR